MAYVTPKQFANKLSRLKVVITTTSFASINKCLASCYANKVTSSMQVALIKVIMKRRSNMIGCLAYNNYIYKIIWIVRAF